MRKVQITASGLLLILLVLFSCAPKPAPAPQAQAPPALPATAAPSTSVPTAPLKPAWQEKWEKTLEAAKQEGRVSLVTGLGFEAHLAIAEGFKAAYGIPVETIAGKGAELTTKILAERRAGLYLHDVHIGGPETSLTSLKPAGAVDTLTPALILPDVTDPELIKKIWYEGQLQWVDKDRTTLNTVLSPGTPIAINTNLVRDGEIKSLKDLLQPKWEGKLVLQDPTAGGAGLTFVQFAEDRLGWDYVVQLLKTKPIVLSDTRLMLLWLANGKVALVAGPKPDIMSEFARLGAPIKGLIPEEGTWLGAATASLAILKRQEHPNASKVFVNWLLSKDGSTIVSKMLRAHMTRLDVPTDHLLPEWVRDPKTNYFNQTTEELVLKKPDIIARVRPLVAPLTGR